MKQDFTETLKKPVNLRKMNVALILVPALLWLGTVNLREYILETTCVKNPTLCVQENINQVDRISVQWSSSEADALSTHMQNLSGFIAATTPFALQLAKVSSGSQPLAQALVLGLTDLSILIQTVAWNGTLTETARLLGNRPRPFVYSNPAFEGQQLHNYTSFYSGHVSFIAASLFGLLLILYARKVPFIGIVGAGLCFESILLMGAITRVLSGRHFITDVIIGAMMGITVAFTVAYLNRKYT